MARWKREEKIRLGFGFELVLPCQELRGSLLGHRAGPLEPRGCQLSAFPRREGREEGGKGEKPRARSRELLRPGRCCERPAGATAALRLGAEPGSVLPCPPRGSPAHLSPSPAAFSRPPGTELGKEKE